MSLPQILELSECSDKDHACVWKAIDALAASQGLTSSGLARRAGLDPTTFNRSKRTTSNGRPRWPSTESLAKVLAATGTTPQSFGRLLEQTMRNEAQSRVLLHELRDGYVSAKGKAIEKLGRLLWPFRLAPDTEHNAMIVSVTDSSVEPIFHRGCYIVALRDSLPGMGGIGLFRATRKRTRLCKIIHREESSFRLRPLTRDEPAGDFTVHASKLELSAHVVWTCHATVNREQPA